MSVLDRQDAKLTFSPAGWSDPLNYGRMDWAALENVNLLILPTIFRLRWAEGLKLQANPDVF
jgi:hypothetical protein